MKIKTAYLRDKVYLKKALELRSKYPERYPFVSQREPGTIKYNRKEIHFANSIRKNKCPFDPS